jgi:glycosyltransferase involved in cell wall biosynthesis
MRILYVVQRYGERIVGGSEAACRAFAEMLHVRGHEVEVLTSCAHNYVDWADEYPEGTEVINGVVVHRLGVIEPRSDSKFGPIHARLMANPDSLPLFEQQRWARLMGPDLRGQRSWLTNNALRFDVVVFMTYLYATCTNGLPAVAGRVPVVLQPTAHDEPPAYVPLYQTLFRLPDAFLFFTPEERAVVERIYGLDPAGAVVGIGIEQSATPGSEGVFRENYSLEDSPYLVYVGRLDPSKGVGELIRFFLAYKQRHHDQLKLVLVGDGDLDVPESPDIIKTGFVEEQTKRDALAGALALVQCSYFESFSIVLCEAWAQGTPALVQGKCEVLRGQAMRSGGAVPYEGFAEFESATEMLLADGDLAATMGRNGKDYVSRNYVWQRVIEGVETTLNDAIVNFGQRRLRTTPRQ